MTNKTSTFYVNQVLKAYEEAANNSIIKMTEKEPPSGKTWKFNTKFMGNRFKVEDDYVPVRVYITEVPIVTTPVDPNDATDPRKDYIHGKERQIYISGNKSGGYGDMVKYVDRDIEKTIEQMEKDGRLKAKWTGVRFNHMFRDKYGENADTKAGQNYTDIDGNPDIRIPFRLDFETFDSKEEGKPGIPKTIIKDFNTARPILDENGNGIGLEYDNALVDGRPVDETNVHKFITPGSEIIEGYISFKATSKSGQGISTKQIAEMLVIKPGVKQNTMEMKSNAHLLARLEQVKKQNAGQIGQATQEINQTTQEVNELTEKMSQQTVSDETNHTLIQQSAKEALDNL